MINTDIYDYSKEALIYYLRHECGSSNPDYFNAKKAGGMKLQQIPEEYSELLLMLKDFGAETYLALGIGNGGSFAMECFFMKETLKQAIAVDCLAYRNLNIGQCEEEIISFVSMVESYKQVEISKDRFFPKIKTQFKNCTTDNYFLDHPDCLFDVIFIDADHSYEGARKDYDNALNHIEKNGLIIFHDINSAACPGIQRLWQEAKADHKGNWELIASKTCGIGVIQVRG